MAASTPDLDTVGALAVRDVPRVGLSQRAGEALRSVLARPLEAAADIAVVEGDRLVGVVALERLVAAGADRPVAELVDASFASISEHADREHAAALAARLGVRSVAVVDEEGRLRGLVPRGNGSPASSSERSSRRASSDSRSPCGTTRVSPPWSRSR